LLFGKVPVLKTASPLRLPYRRPLLSLLLIALAFSCGIELIIYLERPRRTYETSYLDDLSKRYCQFNTADEQNTANAGAYFQGTEIYYRIYEQESDCTSDTAQINRYNENTPSTAAQYLKETKKYYRLTTTDVSKQPLIGRYSSNANVRFRLQSYGGTTDPAVLAVNGISLGTPLRDIRILAAKRGFDRENISADDEDVQKGSSSSGVHEFWCVNFYAVSYGNDASLKSLYSELEPLGFIKIEKKP